MKYHHSRHTSAVHTLMARGNIIFAHLVLGIDARLRLHDRRPCGPILSVDRCRAVYNSRQSREMPGIILIDVEVARLELPNRASIILFIDQHNAKFAILLSTLILGVLQYLQYKPQYSDGVHGDPTSE
jgi:hypothetical protein